LERSWKYTCQHRYSHKQPWAKSANSLDRLTPAQGKKEKTKLNNKQADEKKHIAGFP
jgi:hypothetical protein